MRNYCQRLNTLLLFSHVTYWPLPLYGICGNQIRNQLAIGNTWWSREPRRPLGSGAPGGGGGRGARRPREEDRGGPVAPRHPLRGEGSGRAGDRAPDGRTHQGGGGCPARGPNGCGKHDRDEIRRSWRAKVGRCGVGLSSRESEGRPPPSSFFFVFHKSWWWKWRGMSVVGRGNAPEGGLVGQVLGQVRRSGQLRRKKVTQNV